MIPPHVETFLEVFGGSAAQTEIIDKIGYPVGASDTDNGVTITADAVRLGTVFAMCSLSAMAGGMIS